MGWSDHPQEAKRPRSAHKGSLTFVENLLEKLEADLTRGDWTSRLTSGEVTATDDRLCTLAREVTDR
uniref:Uncharacterized protein n=1 Tax=viral metagenome TaxID=1070528 RepID=A0A6C0IWV1_9ZZZZ